MKHELTPIETHTLKACERTIESTKGAFVACGLALSKIQQGKLYRGSYDNFEAYCKEKWGWGRQRAYQLIEAAEVKEGLPENCKPLVYSERQARALASTPPEERQAVLERAKEGGRVTTAGIAKAAKEKEIPLDKTGVEIPQGIMEDWRRAEEFSEVLKDLSRIKCTVEAALNDKDVIFSEINNTTVATLKNAYGDLQRVIPYAVCPTCGGHQRKSCTACRKRGWLSKFLYDTTVPEEVKKMRKK